MSVALAEWLHANGGAISGRVIDEMYADDPFWAERFGPAGRTHAHEDGGFHIRHLVTAIRFSDDGLMRTYAGWLRGILTARGMATVHLVDNFERLSAALVAAASGHDTQPIKSALTSAIDGLAYDHPAAAGVASNSEQLAHAWLARAGIAADHAHVADARVVLGFIADALAFPHANGLLGYVAYRAAHPRGLWLARTSEHLRAALPADLAKPWT